MAATSRWGSNTEAAEQLLRKQFFHLQQSMAHSLFVGIAQKSFQCFSIRLNSIGPVILAEAFLRQPRMLKAPGNRKLGCVGSRARAILRFLASSNALNRFTAIHGWRSRTSPRIATVCMMGNIDVC